MTRLLITASNSFKCTIKLETQGNRKVSLADRHRVVVGPLHGRSTRLPMFASRLACMGTTPNVSTSETQTLEQDTVFRRGFSSGLSITLVRAICTVFARYDRANFGMVDRFCQPFSSNASRNKSVLHVLGANCPKAQVDNLCPKRPRQSIHQILENRTLPWLETFFTHGNPICATL